VGQVARGDPEVILRIRTGIPGGRRIAAGVALLLRMVEQHIEDASPHHGESRPRLDPYTNGAVGLAELPAAGLEHLHFADSLWFLAGRHV